MSNRLSPLVPMHLCAEDIGAENVCRGLCWYLFGSSIGETCIWLLVGTCTSNCHFPFVHTAVAQVLCRAQRPDAVCLGWQLTIPSSGLSLLQVQQHPPSIRWCLGVTHSLHYMHILKPCQTNSLNIIQSWKS